MWKGGPALKGESWEEGGEAMKEWVIEGRNDIHDEHRCVVIGAQPILHYLYDTGKGEEGVSGLTGRSTSGVTCCG
jgi:hypothetical protein